MNAIVNAERSLLDLKRRSVGEVINGLKASSKADSIAAGQQMLSDAASFGLSLKDYLDLAITSEKGMTGAQQALMALNLPLRQDFASGSLLQAASETFQMHPGTRALFPEVIDAMLQWADRQDQFERVEDVVGLSRTTNGVVLLSTVVDDDSNDRDTNTVPEGARIPVKSIRTSQKTVTFYKHGSALRFTYEFNRRASLDLITPYAARIARELERSKLTAAVNVLINGDGVQSAAPEVDQSGYNSAVGNNSTNGAISWEHFLYWLVQRAKAGTPVDTIVGNWDSAFKWLQLTSKADSNDGKSSVEYLAKALGVADTSSLVAPFRRMSIPLPNFVVASAAPSSKLVGFTKSETLEELKEAGSDLSENEKAILNQTITYTKTENTGYRIVYGDTRSVFDYGN